MIYCHYFLLKHCIKILFILITKFFRTPLILSLVLVPGWPPLQGQLKTFSFLCLLVDLPDILQVSVKMSSLLFNFI